MSKVLASAIAALACAAGCNDAPSTQPRRASGVLVAAQQEPLQPLPVRAEQNAAQVALGAKLFSDSRLSADGTVACATCHVPSKAGQDGRPVSLGIQGRAGVVNAPTVLNCGFNFVQFWDGRATTLEEQMGFPLTNPNEMGTSWSNVLSYLTGDADYRRR
ncbi:MAG: cytochrome-c peroxidase, partial [Polyangiaceae bacterium]